MAPPRPDGRTGSFPLALLSSVEDVARLSPLKFKNLNVLGRYSFTPSTPTQGLRPLRNPDAPELDDEDGAED
ncbi:hypothetical protein [Streptomyces sp. UNOC14_S4]|uniref:hypothetical protein n=1 Tax=Streptomyces sp. UNOC14_S4 TaxID=2872340 RepID=UPI001E2CC92A|nr:hypothetical protein [Streptomyces sp. UNOC14_S4]MCC3769539.1 hypothetical protein [Streptomyces sp. UNOC14_S4]